MGVENAGSGRAVVVEARQGIVTFNAKQQAIVENKIEARLCADKATIGLEVHRATPRSKIATWRAALVEIVIAVFGFRICPAPATMEARVETGPVDRLCAGITRSAACECYP